MKSRLTLSLLSMKVRPPSSEETPTSSGTRRCHSMVDCVTLYTETTPTVKTGFRMMYLTADTSLTIQKTLVSTLKITEEAWDVQLEILVLAFTASQTSSSWLRRQLPPCVPVPHASKWQSLPSPVVLGWLNSGEIRARTGRSLTFPRENGKHPGTAINNHDRLFLKKRQGPSQRLPFTFHHTEINVTVEWLG